MNRTVFCLVAIWLALLSAAFTGCNVAPILPNPAALPPTPPAPTATPVCAALASVALPPPFDALGQPLPLPSPLLEIRSQADWNNYCQGSNPVLPAPVDFSRSMILAYVKASGDSCTDYAKITGVCYFSDHIVVSYDFRSASKDASCQPVACAQVYLRLSTREAVEVPASALPLVWVQNDLCP